MYLLCVRITYVLTLRLWCRYDGPSCGRVTVGVDQCPFGCRGTPAAFARGDEARGICALGRCFCHPGWRGEACGEVVALPCPADCSQHGTCHLGRCACEIGFHGDACEKRASPPRCPAQCNDNGVCVNGACVCDPGFDGLSCESPSPRPCPNRCSGNGMCVMGSCFCRPGFAGAQCASVVPLPHIAVQQQQQQQQREEQGGGGGGGDAVLPEIRFKSSRAALVPRGEGRCGAACAAHGECYDDKCFCNPGWRGEACAARVPCPVGGCGANGVCELGASFGGEAGRGAEWSSSILSSFAVSTMPWMFTSSNRVLSPILFLSPTTLSSASLISHPLRLQTQVAAGATRALPGRRAPTRCHALARSPARVLKSDLRRRKRRPSAASHSCEGGTVAVAMMPRRRRKRSR